jgi:RNA polymerase sigma factor (sigma-70 family)
LTDASCSEKELLLKIAERDEKATGFFFNTYFPRLVFFVNKLISNDQEAEDIAIQTLTVFWQQNQKTKYESLSKTEAFIFSVARNRAYNFNKREKMKLSKEKAIVETTKSLNERAEALLVQEEIFNRVYKEILLLAPNQLQIVRMIFIEGMETGEIAKSLNTTANNIRNQKARILEKIRILVYNKGITDFQLIFLLFFCDIL